MICYVRRAPSLAARSLSSRRLGDARGAVERSAGYLKRVTSTRLGLSIAAIATMIGSASSAQPEVLSLSEGSSAKWLEQHEEVIGQAVAGGPAHPLQLGSGGRNDPAIVHSGTPTLSILLAHADGGFQTPAVSMTSNGPLPIVAAQSALNSQEDPESDYCYPDCDENGRLDIFDVLCFLNRHAAEDPYADCDADGSWNFFDFLCFLNQFSAGCP